MRPTGFVFGSKSSGSKKEKKGKKTCVDKKGKIEGECRVGWCRCVKKEVCVRRKMLLKSVQREK